jgi:hypothetical protein
MYGGLLQSYTLCHTHKLPSRAHGMQHGIDLSRR